MAAFPSLSVNPSYPLDPDGDIEDAVIRAPFEAGYRQTRPRFTRARRKFGLSYDMPKADRDTLKTFEATTLRNGADKFDWTHPIDGTVHVVQLSKPISYKHNTFGRYDVKVEIEEV